MVSKRYTHLFFDLDNTIWDFNANSKIALHLALQRLDLLGSIGPFERYFEIYQQVNDRLWDEYRQGTMTKKMLSSQRFEEPFETLKLPLPLSGEKINQAYLEAMTEQTQLIDGARELLDHLHNRYPMALITNGFKEVQYEKLERSGLAKYFKKVFVSEEVGVQKPGKGIFEHALKSMNAPKKSSVMIGDSWEADIVGAKRVGIDQIYFNPDQKRLPHDATAVIAIESIGKHPLLHLSAAGKTTVPKTATKGGNTVMIAQLHDLFHLF